MTQEQLLGSSQTLGFVFPGQGSQKEGMLAELATQYPEIQSTFSEASSVLGYDLWALTQNDPDNQLSRTHITQPVMLTASVAIWRLWLELGGCKPGLMAGHSLGEYSALVCSGVLDFKAAVALVQKRGEYMQKAVPEGVGGMAAIVGLRDDVIKECCKTAAENQVVDPVNFNSPGQVVIAGHSEAVERAMGLCKEAGAKRCLSLPVSAPFHSSLMQSAADGFAEELDKMQLNLPEIPVLQNYGLQASKDVELIRDNLLKQIYHPVRWVETIQGFAAQGVESIAELGPGKVLNGLNRRIDKSIKGYSINDPANLQVALEQIQ